MVASISIGIDIGGTSVKSGIARLEDGALAFRSGSTIDVGRNRFANLRQVVVQLVQEALQFEGYSAPVCVGISTTGIVDCNEKVASAHFYSDYKDVSWKAEIKQDFGERIADVAVLNDGNAAAWSQYAAHAHTGVQDIVHLSIGTGVGGGIISGGELLLGAACAAGELGHVVVVSDGRLCQCGRKGCVQAYAGSRSIVEIASQSATQSGDSVVSRLADFRQLVELAAAGNSFAQAAIEQAGHYLGIAIATLANVLNPRIVTLGGGVTAAVAQHFEGTANPLMSKLLESASANTLGFNLRDLEIIPAEHGNDASWIGAATYARSRYETTGR